MRTNYIAFFDLDGTIINLKSMFDFMEYYLKTVSKTTIGGIIKAKIFKCKFYLISKLIKEREQINAWYYSNFEGVSYKSLMILGEQWWHDVKGKYKNIYNNTVREELEQHQSNNATTVLVTGSMYPCIKPIMDELEITDCLAATLEVINGKLTGKLLSKPNIGEEKANRMKVYLEKEQKLIDKQQCYAYGDHYSDLSMLNKVGHPVVVGGDRALRYIAERKHWKIIYN